MLLLFTVSDRCVARSFGEAEKQRDASGEEAWMAAIGLFQFLCCMTAKGEDLTGGHVQGPLK